MGQAVISNKNAPEASADGGPSDIDRLLQGNPRLWRGCEMAGQGDHGQATGFAALDAILPGRGWPDSGLVEIVSPCWGMGELQLLLPLIRSLVRQGQWILWISPPYLLYAPALVQAGIDIHQVLVVDLDTSCKDALWTMEKALQTENCGLVLAWQNWLPDKVLRRLQLAAEAGDTLGVLFRRNVSEHSHSSMRLLLKDSHGGTGGIQQTAVTVARARGNFRPLHTTLDLGTGNGSPGQELDTP